VFFYPSWQLAPRVPPSLFPGLFRRCARLHLQVVLDDGKTWESIREKLAQHFIDASLPETARLVKIE